jgi:inner membrane protein
MEPVTHFLTGAVLSRTGFNRKSALATLTMVLAAEAADIDMLAYFQGSARGFMAHRGITHTFLAVPFLAALTAGLVWLGDAAWQARRRSRGKPAPPERRWRVLFWLACLACLSHLLLDFTNDYGLRPFYPFSNHWYAWDTVFIFEPLMTAALLAALVLPALLALVTEEIGVRRKGPRGRAAAIAALLFIVLLWTVRDVEHRRALASMDALEYGGEPAVRIAAFPYPANPFRWAGVAETSNAYLSMKVDSLRGVVDPDHRAESYYKPQPTPATEAAAKSDLGVAYLDWARFPLVESEPMGGPGKGYLVHFSDLRFFYPESPRRPLRAFVLLNSELQVEAEGFESMRAER